MAVTVKNRPPIGPPNGVRRKASFRTRTAPDSVMRIIEQAKENPMSAGELAAENARLMAYGAGQAKKAGIKERDILRVIHEARSRPRTS
ncbi:MAG TPA: hypothetical protein VN924_03615 [Bryobacteraceae bacterium]|nr:hypothetical protein [Bryobacteraceae bacterium]